MHYIWRIFILALIYSCSSEYHPEQYKIPTTPMEGQPQLQNFIWKEAKSEPNYLADLPKKKIIENADCLGNMPIINISINKEDLFDHEKGIYVPGKHYQKENWKQWWPPGNFTKKWRKKAFLQYFTKEGILTFSDSIKLKVVGFAVSSYPQKSLKISFSDTANTNLVFPKLNYNPKKIILRNSGQDFTSTHFRDAFVQNLAQNLKFETQANQPVIVYLNGEYWGIHNMREKLDEDYFTQKYPIHKKDLTILENCDQIEWGNRNEFIQLLDQLEMDSLNRWNNIQKNIDVKSVCEYLVFQFYIANFDWPGVNNLYWKYGKGKWQWMLNDTDYSFGFETYIPNTKANFNPFKNALQANGPSWPNPDCSTEIWRYLFSTKEFRDQFKITSDSLMNSLLTRENLHEELNKYIDLYIEEMPRHIERWNYPESMNKWESEVDSMHHFIENREIFYNRYMKEFLTQKESAQ